MFYKVSSAGVWKRANWMIFLLMIVCLGAEAQTFPNLKFTKLNVRNGLSSNAVTCTHQDSKGIIWIATNKGLNRYDGTGVKVFRHLEADPGSIASDIVISIVEDREKQLWLGTLNGISRFNPRTGKASNYFKGRRFTFKDSKNRIWLTADSGVQLYDYKKNILTNYRLPGKGMAEGEHGALLVYKIKQDRHGRIWAQGNNMMYLVDERRPELIAFSSDQGMNPNVLQEALGTNMVNVNDTTDWTDNRGNNWLVTAANGGVILQDRKSRSSKVYHSDNLNPAALDGYNIAHVMKDDQNRLWFSTDNGINIVDPYIQFFENMALYQQLNLNNPKIFGLPNNLLETEDRFYMTSAPAKGYYIYDKQWRLLKHVVKVPEYSASPLSRAVNSILKDDAHNFWFSTDSGLVKKEGKGYKIFFPEDIDISRKENLAFSKMYKRKDGLFWIRARQNGIYLFNPKTGIFIKQYKPDEVNIKGSVYSCYLDGEGVLWAGSIGGISRYLAGQDAFGQVKVYGKDGKERKIGWVTDITEDQDHVIWAVSDAGLLKINKTTGVGLLIDSKSGLPENLLKRIMVDTVGNLWIPSQQGIVKYDRKKKFSFFNINSGLPFQYEGHGFFERSAEGDFLLGFSGYVTRFNPYLLQTNDVVSRAVFMDVSVDGKEISLAGYDADKKVVLPAGSKILNIHFAITNYTAPDENRYFYKIGGRGHWQEVRNGHVALGGLSYGSYPLWIKGANNNGVYSKEECLTISVLPHWTETKLFLFSCVFICIAVLTWLWRRRISFIRRQFQMKQQLSESKLKAIRSQMNPHFIFNVLNSIESYIMESDKKTASRMVQKFAGLSRLILENSTQRVVPVAKEWKALQLYTELEAMRFSNHFAYSFECDPLLQLQHLMVPPMLIQPLIENAIHHGLRHYPNGVGILKVQLRQEGETLVFVVTDNGIGLEAAALHRSHSNIKRQSLAIEGIRERIAAINAVASVPSASFSIDERKGDESGTIAIVRLPVMYQMQSNTF